MYDSRQAFAVVIIVALLFMPGGAGHAQPTAASGSTAEAGDDGFRVASEDGAFLLRLRGDLYTDARFFPGTTVSPGAERIFLRRVRPRLQGQLYERFAFSVRSDFGIGGPEIDDAFVDVQFSPALHLRMGRFKVPVGLETLQSSTGLMHVERGFPAGLVPGRDVGVMLAGTVAQTRLRYAIGLFNGTPGVSEPGADVDNAKEGAVRLFATPFADADGVLSGLGIGIAGTVGETTGTPATPGLLSLRTTGRQTFFQYRTGSRADGTRWRVAPQARLYAGPVELLGEYTVARQDVRRGTTVGTLTHRAWQISGAMVLTGEEAQEGEVVPRDPFGAETGSGAFEVGARVHGVTIDDNTFPAFAAPSAAAPEARAWGLTVSWYPTAMVRMMLGYERTTFQAAGSVSAREAENLLLTRIQIAF